MMVMKTLTARLIVTDTPLTTTAPAGSGVAKLMIVAVAGRASPALMNVGLDVV